MFRTLRRYLLPNPLDLALRRLAKRGGKKVLLGWNRGLGDIALGLFAIVHRIRELVPDSEIVFLTRENLRDGFSMLSGVKIIIAPSWKRGNETNVKQTLLELGIDPKSFDLIIEKPSPTDWVQWQRGCLVPRLQWDVTYDDAWKKFDLPDGYTYVGIQAVVETNYGTWRSWSFERLRDLVHRLEYLPKVKVILFGERNQFDMSFPHVIDLRGETTLFELLSIIKNRCSSLIVPDSGILSMTYYLDASFPLHLISLWADPNHGVLKQAVASPNPRLKHTSLIGRDRDLSSVTVEQVMNVLFPIKPLTVCRSAGSGISVSLEKTGCIILAGGQGSRLGVQGPKGLFSIHGKSLFEWICEKTPLHLPIAVMTSPLNHEETVRFFEYNRYFGRKISFFQQAMHSAKNHRLRAMPEICLPKGNGAMFKAFVASGLCDEWTRQGIEVCTIVPVDNPLADPVDGALIECLCNQDVDVVLKCVPRENNQELMGALVEREGHIEVAEYIDLSSHVSYCFSYTGMMAMRISFIETVASIDLPIHWVKKKFLQRWVWKGEEFIFDSLPYGRVAALCYEKKSCYAPLKGIESVESVRQLLVDCIK